MWKWILALVVVAALGYAVIRQVGHGSSAEPSPADVQLSRSLQLYQGGQYQESIAAAQESLKLKADYAPAYNNLAVANLQLKNYDEAIRNAREAIRVQPDYELAKNNLAWILREKQKADAPPPAPLKPGTADFYLQQSLDQYQAANYQQAIVAAEQALKLDPKMAAAYNNISVSYTKLGMWDKAIQNALKALEIQPDYQLAQNNLTWALKSKGEASTAKK